jgi:hypothetical protein
MNCWAQADVCESNTTVFVCEDTSIYLSSSDYITEQRKANLLVFANIRKGLDVVEFTFFLLSRCRVPIHNSGFCSSSLKIKL